MPRFALGVACAAALAATPSLAFAQGFQVNEHGTCVMGRAGVGTPKPCDDGSAIFYNPAGIAGTGTVVSLGVTGIYAYGSFAADYTGEVTDLENPLVPVPHAFFTYGITPKLTATFSESLRPCMGMATVASQHRRTSGCTRRHSVQPDDHLNNSNTDEVSHYSGRFLRKQTRALCRLGAFIPPRGVAGPELERQAARRSYGDSSEKGAGEKRRSRTLPDKS